MQTYLENQLRLRQKSYAWKIQQNCQRNQPSHHQSEFGEATSAVANDAAEETACVTAASPSSSLAFHEIGSSSQSGHGEGPSDSSYLTSITSKLGLTETILTRFAGFFNGASSEEKPEETTSTNFEGAAWKKTINQANIDKGVNKFEESEELLSDQHLYVGDPALSPRSRLELQSSTISGHQPPSPVRLDSNHPGAATTSTPKHRLRRRTRLNLFFQNVGRRLYSDSRVAAAVVLFGLLSWWYSDVFIFFLRIAVVPILRLLLKGVWTLVLHPLYSIVSTVLQQAFLLLLAFWPTTLDDKALEERLIQHRYPDLVDPAVKSQFCIPLPPLPSAVNPINYAASFFFRAKSPPPPSSPEGNFETDLSNDESLLWGTKLYLFVVNFNFHHNQPLTMLNLIYLLSRLVFGTLYPAYCSYKAVKSKNVREYVKWMMYWIVFALFTSAETFADIFISWLPFYYEIKVIFVVWLLSPYTNGSSFLYRKFVHPTLVKKENEIDDMISKAKEQGYSAVLTLGAKGISYATNLAVQAATKGPVMLDQFRRSYSTSDVTITEITDEDDPPRYDNDLALVQARRPRSNALDSEEVLPSDEEMTRYLLISEEEFAGRLSRTSGVNDLSKESSWSRGSSISRESSFSLDPATSTAPLSSHHSLQRHSIVLGESLQHEDLLRRFSELTPVDQRRLLRGDSDFGNLTASKEDIYLDDNGRKVTLLESARATEETSKESLERKPTRPSAPPPALPKHARASAAERRAAAEKAAAAAVERKTASEKAAAAGKTLRVTAVPMGVHRRVKSKEEKL